jgi:hypothetical protein
MAYDSLSQYILFSSGSSAKTREWSRYEGLSCGNQEKLKYTILKNPPATVVTPVVGCASRATTVDVAGRTYAIDPSIFQALQQSLQVAPVSTLNELQARIAEIRVLVNRPAPLPVQLQNSPLARYKQRTTYLAGASKWPDVVRPIARNFQFKVGAPIDIPLASFPPIALYQEFFFKRKFILQNAQYVYVANNDGCGYTGKIDDIYTTASRSGDLIKALQSTRTLFTPIACLMQPAGAQYPIKFGLLMGINSALLSAYTFQYKNSVLKALARNSELVFIPAQTQIEMIENVDLPVNMGVTFPLTNGGIFRPDFLQSYNSALAQFYLSNPAFKTLQPNIPNFAPQLAFPDNILAQIIANLA